MRRIEVIIYQSQEKVLTETWSEFKEVYKTLVERSVIFGIKHFFMNDKTCTAKEVFDVLREHEDCSKLWNTLWYDGGVSQGWFCERVIKSFEQEYAHRDDILELYATFTNPPKNFSIEERHGGAYTSFLEEAYRLAG